MRNIKSKGVTLFEIMLVVAISGVIIVAGVRYYNNAQLSQGVNIMLNQISNLTSSADRLAINSGNYNVVNSSNIASMNGGTQAMSTPFNNSQYQISNTSSTGYSVVVGCLPPAACLKLKAALLANPKFNPVTCTAQGACVSGGGAGNVLGWTYNNTN